MLHRDVARYSNGAADLARFREDPADAAIESFVERAGADAAAALDEDSCYTLLLFAHRAAARALRERNLRIAKLGVRALTLVDRDRIDVRDLSVDFPLYAVRELGGDLDAEIDGAVRHSVGGTAQSFEAARERAKGISLADCGLFQVSTNYGLGFVEDWTAPTRRR